MRKVVYSEYVKGEGNKWGLVEKGEALFHQWGSDTHSKEGGGSFSTAIIELGNETVKNIQVEHVRFISGEML